MTRPFLLLAALTSLTLLVSAACNQQSDKPQPTGTPSPVPASPTPAPTSAAVPGAPRGSLIYLSSYGYSPNLYSIRPDGSGLTQLTDSPEADRLGGFSPDGKLLAFSSRFRDDGQPNGLYVMSSDGSNVRLVAADAQSGDYASDPRTAEFVSWSSRGRILYVQAGHQVYGDYWTSNADGSDAAPISEKNACGNPVDWSPDGQNLVLCQCSFDPHAPDAFSSCSLSVVDAHGGLVRTLIQGSPTMLQSPTWSPNGNEILFVNGDERSSLPSTSLSIIDADGSNLRTLPQDVAKAQWSPDGSQILSMTSNEIVAVSPTDGSARTIANVHALSIAPDGSKAIATKGDEIDIVSLADASSRTVASTTNFVEDPSWSPDSDKIAYTSRVPMTFESTLCVVDTGDGESRDLAFPVDNTGITWSPDSEQTVFASSTKRRAGVWWISPDGSERGRLDKLSTQNTPPNQPTVTGVTGSCINGPDQFSCLSPDGNSEAFMSGSNTLTVKDLASGASSTIDIEGSQQWDASPVWSNDGTKIAVQGGDSGKWRLYIVDVPTATAWSVAEDARAGESYPPVAWSPDDSWVYYVKTSNGFVYRVRTDGTGQQQLTDMRVDRLYGFVP